MNPLIIIPARGGSKGIPGKNIKPLLGQPLLAYTLAAARQVAPDERIILSTDSEEIRRVAESLSLAVPYMRPAELATDASGSREVILDVMDWADAQGIDYDCVVLLQPTSPLRTADDIRQCMDVYDLYAPNIDMAVTVVEAASNPYYNCFEAGEDGFLHISKGDGLITRRQDAPKVWEYNGAVYVIRPQAIREMPLGAMPRRAASPMPRERSVDIDTEADWRVAEYLLTKTLSL